MKPNISLRIDQRMYEQLHRHLFRSDNDEHGAVIAAGIATTDQGVRLLARELFLARDGIEYVPGQRGYRALTAAFVAERVEYCAAERLCYIAVHNHPGEGAISVGLSGDDLASQARGYPALLDISDGGPVGGIVFADKAAAGKIWFGDGTTRPLSDVTVVGTHTYKLTPRPELLSFNNRDIYDRSSRIYGDEGQAILQSLRIGIIGVGGGGSLISEWISRLGIGEIIAIDPDRLDITNLPRVVGSTRLDAMAMLSLSRFSWLRKLGRRMARRKVSIARRVAVTARPELHYTPIFGDVLDQRTADLLCGLDFIFLATDSIQSRLVFNAMIHQYLIPGMQVGAKVQVEKVRGTITDIVAVTRPVLPHDGGGCLDCANLIPAAKLQEEALTPEERARQRYVDDPEVVEPSVLPLNVLSAAQGVLDMMFMFTGLFNGPAKLLHQMHFARERTLELAEIPRRPGCPDCGIHSRSRRARGDRARLPCRQRTIPTWRR